MTEDDLTRLKALEAAATKGPWYAYPNSDCIASEPEMLTVAKIYNGTLRDAELIVAMRNALPALLARIEALTVERDQWQSRAQTAWDQMDADMRRSIETAIAALEPSK